MGGPTGPTLALQPLCLALSSGPSFRKIPGVFPSLPWLAGGAVPQGLQVEIMVSLGRRSRVAWVPRLTPKVPAPRVLMPRRPCWAALPPHLGLELCLPWRAELGLNF